MNINTVEPKDGVSYAAKGWLKTLLGLIVVVILGLAAKFALDHLKAGSSHHDSFDDRTAPNVSY